MADIIDQPELRATHQLTTAQFQLFAPRTSGTFFECDEQRDVARGGQSAPADHAHECVLVA